MTRKFYPYSLKSEDAKIAGVCSTLSQIVGIDPTILRICFVASAIFISFQWTLVAYAAIGIYLVVKKKKNVLRGSRDQSEFDRMADVSRRPSTVHSMVNDLDVNDRRMMAIDHHLNTPNDELAREIEALRKEDK
jgi:phage shock protein PspC (stress-responsive transcriptional regulator)